MKSEDEGMKGRRDGGKRRELECKGEEKQEEVLSGKRGIRKEKR